MPPFPALAESLSGWLCQRVNILDVEKCVYAAGFVIPNRVVPSDRLILLRRGSLHYEAEGCHFQFKQGTQIYVPAWIQRGWTAAEKCELLWVEFGPSAAPAELATPLHTQKAATPLDKEAYARLLGWWQKPKVPLRPLLMEAEFKALLARMFAQCKISPRKEAPKSAAEQTVAKLMGDLKKNFADPSALAATLASNSLSANYTRRLFREQTGTTVNGYLTRLRMHEARYRLRETSLTVKEVACAVGYADPLWFSKLYRRFWGHAPLFERQ